MLGRTGFEKPEAGKTLPDREAGQALVEFALVAPIQLLIILFVIQLGHVLVGKQILAYGSHVAARAALVGRDPYRAASLVCSAVSPITSGTRLAVPGWGPLPRSTSALDRTRIAVVETPGEDAGRVRAVVDHDFHLIVPVVNVFFADRLARDEFTMHLRSQSVAYKPWSDRPEAARGHPWIPDVPLETRRRWTR